MLVPLGASHVADVEDVAVDPDLAAAGAIDMRHELGIVR